MDLGHRVLVPFGRRNVEGYVVELTDAVDLKSIDIKQIKSLLDPKPLLNKEQLHTAKWMAKNYNVLWSQTLQLFLPVGTRYGRERVRPKEQLMAVVVDYQFIDNYLERTALNAHKQRAVLQRLKQQPQQLARQLCLDTGASYQTLYALRDKGWIKLQLQSVERSLNLIAENKADLRLNQEQEQAVQQIITQFGHDGKPVLLHGVTGSGKTEVYLHAMAYCLQNGNQAIMLVPEIALTPQTIALFTQRFPNQVAVLHSGLSEGERYDQWQKIYHGKVSIVIGARSAVFAPFDRIGLIILDEEHETTYKQTEGSLKYHAREIALKRASYSHAVVVLGSATPALESYHSALNGHYQLAELPYRIKNYPMPKISLVDMRKEFKEGNRTMFSRELYTALEETIAREEQAIVFLNRRGYASFVLCRECGRVLECPNCKVSLTYHLGNRLKCHYCDYQQSMPSTCPNCGSHYLRQFGCGTQQVEQYIQEKFPQAITIRLDSDTTRRKGTHQRLLNRFKSGKANILIGTQMIAKGLDFPNVTLVGVLSADLTLNFPDFRSSERTFQLLTQVSGRAGRDVKLGRVVIQCYDPNHYALQSVVKQDYLAFYRQEISFRRALGYPPYGHVVRILIQGEEQQVKETAEKIYSLLKQQVVDAEVFPPVPAPIVKIKGRFRWHILIKSKQLLAGLAIDRFVKHSDVNVSVDDDPLFLL